MEIMVFMSIVSIAAVILSIIMTVKFFQAITDIKKIRESVCVEKKEVLNNSQKNISENKISPASSFTEKNNADQRGLVLIVSSFVVIPLLFFSLIAFKNKNSQTSVTTTAIDKEIISERVEEENINYTFSTGVYSQIYTKGNLSQYCSENAPKKDLKMFLTKKTIEQLNLNTCDSILRHDYFFEGYQEYEYEEHIGEKKYFKTECTSHYDHTKHIFFYFKSENDTIKMTLLKSEISEIKNGIIKEKEEKRKEEIQKEKEDKKRENKTLNGY